MLDQFLGFVTLGGTLTGTFLTRNASFTPTDATGNPTYRIYGASGLMTNGTGSLGTFKNSGNVTGATDASPIVITSVGHGLTTGTNVTIVNVGGNTAANGVFQITRLSADTFSLDGSTGNGAYTSGGTWHVTALYAISYVPTGGNGFEAGSTYTMIVTAIVSGTVKASVFTFIVA